MAAKRSSSSSDFPAAASFLRFFCFFDRDSSCSSCSCSCSCSCPCCSSSPSALFPVKTVIGTHARTHIHTQGLGDCPSRVRACCPNTCLLFIFLLDHVRLQLSCQSRVDLFPLCLWRNSASPLFLQFLRYSGLAVLFIRKGFCHFLGLDIQPVVYKKPVHVSPQKVCARQMRQAELMEFVPRHKLEVFIQGLVLRLLHFFGDRFKKGAPLRRRAERRHKP